MIERHLRTFIVVAEEANIHRAAARLHVAQSALSRRITRLEGELGIALFERLPRGLRLTEAGRTLLDDARKITAQVDAAHLRSSRVGHGTFGRLTVGFCDSAPRHAIVPTMLRKFRENNPGVELHLVPKVSEALAMAVRERELDAAFVSVLPKRDRSLRNVSILQEHLVLAIPKGHPLAKRDKIRPRDLKDEPFVWPLESMTDDYSQRLKRTCAERGLYPKIALEAPTEFARLSFVAIGCGITFAYDSAAPLWQHADAIVMKPIEGMRMSAPLDLVWLRTNHSTALQQLTRLVADAASGQNP